MDLNGRSILVGVAGGIAAYWAAELVGVLSRNNADVRVVMTKNAEEFITPLTLKTISRNEVLTGLFDSSGGEIPHIDYARKADCIIIAPATANIIGKIANGIADDALTSIVVASKVPVIICPAMNTSMWTNPLVQDNINKLKKHKYHLVDPEHRDLACGGVGVGHLAEIRSIMHKLVEVVRTEQ